MCSDLSISSGGSSGCSFANGFSLGCASFPKDLQNSVQAQIYFHWLNILGSMYMYVICINENVVINIGLPIWCVYRYNILIIPRKLNQNFISNKTWFQVSVGCNETRRNPRSMLEVYKVTVHDSGEIWWVSRNRRCWKVFKRYTTSCECSTYKFGLCS